MPPSIASEILSGTQKIPPFLFGGDFSRVYSLRWKTQNSKSSDSDNRAKNASLWWSKYLQYVKCHMNDNTGENRKNQGFLLADNVRTLCVFERASGMM